MFATVKAPVPVPPVAAWLIVTFSKPAKVTDGGTAKLEAAAPAMFNVSSPEPPLRLSNALRVAPVPKLPLITSLPEVPTMLSTPDVSVKCLLI